ncbi:uncharacterized protein MONBRDRAFT_12137 [Monosiga brevicollis MX1]|uniref:Uncharacterized protein n=1 Tax=Monosiga brevicollis TaxID=81824 RepID=A9VBC0_MONBE|nr:uncharacterized protein MONBRDRAFT_12137 [Monosiga brevicollis MX1]EDQ85210.1 predicted protein [Monosiga brevicollis MX1]|eukprot:XP_001750035.1 hypothetical protein [Monosiga brevicollis MX1]
MELDKATYGPIAKTFLTACRKGHIEVVQAQLRHENPTVAPRLLGQKDMDGYTGLHKAAYNGHLAVVELLIASGADVNVGTKDNWRPLHCAARWNKAHIIECLLGHGADINAQTNGGLTAMHIAATYVRGLLEFRSHTAFRLPVTMRDDTLMDTWCDWGRVTRATLF